MKKNLLGILAGSLSLLLLLGNAGVVHAQTVSKYTIKARLGGVDRYGTAQKISDAYLTESGTSSLHNIVIATGNDFPDSLSANVLAAKLNAPILLNNAATLSYIKSKSDKTGSVYLIGGTGVVGNDVTTQLKNMGFNVNNIHRIDGKDRFGTNTSIYNNLKYNGLSKGTPIVLVTAFDFPDALSISSIAAIKGYPIVLTESSSLSQSARDIIADDQPSKVYLIGGTGVLKPQIQKDIKSILPGIGSNIKQIGGQDRYDTSAQIMQNFQLGGANCVLATGTTFPDGITGGVLAAKLNAPILLINDASMDKQQLQIDSMDSISSITILGGTGAVSKNVENNILKYQNYIYGFDMMYGTSLDKYKQFKDAGYSFVCRYYSSYSNCLTASEASDISSSGLKIVPIYQDTANNASYFNNTQGVTDAQNAINKAKVVGQTPGTPIYFAVDFDAQTTSDFTKIDQYFDSVKATLNGQYKVGVYGSYYVINEVSKHLGPDTYTWQTRGYSKANINTKCRIYQYQVNTTLFGIPIDKDMTYSTDISTIGGF